jgi:prolyl-tRNA editing enzyme YbaK/EbsC (Cys-tRNA(Pro) deacylase)
MPADERVLAHLAALDIEFEELECDPALADTKQFCEAYGYPLDRSANTIVVASKRPPGVQVACIALASTRLDVNGLIRKRMGVRKVSFASPDETREVTGMEIGGVTAFGLPPGVPIWVDTEVLDRDWVILGAGTRTAKLRLDPAALHRIDGLEPVEDLAVSPP